MAHQHSIEEASPRECLWGLQTAMAQEGSFIIYQVGFAIQYGWPHGILGIQMSGFLEAFYHLLQRVGTVELVTSIQEHQVIALRFQDGLVHRIVQSSVGLADETYLMRMHIDGVVLDILLNKRQGAITTKTIYYEMLNAWISLAGYTFQSSLQCVLGIVSNGNYCKL
jgi:hypothetical protein